VSLAAAPAASDASSTRVDPAAYCPARCRPHRSYAEACGLKGARPTGSTQLERRFAVLYSVMAAFGEVLMFPPLMGGPVSRPRPLRLAPMMP